MSFYGEDKYHLPVPIWVNSALAKIIYKRKQKRVATISEIIRALQSLSAHINQGLYLLKWRSLMAIGTPL